MRRLIGIIFAFLCGVIMTYFILDKGEADWHQKIILYCGGIMALFNALFFQAFPKINEAHLAKGLDYLRKEKLLAQLNQTRQALKYEWLICFIASLLCIILGIIMSSKPKDFLYLGYIGYPFSLIALISCVVVFFNYIQLSKLITDLARSAEIAEMRAKQLVGLTGGSNKNQFVTNEKQAVPKT